MGFLYFIAVSMVSYVKVGRLARILRGPRKDRVGIITAIIDANRVLVENPKDEKMWRHVQSLQNIEPTKFAIELGTNASTATLKKKLAEKDIVAKYEKTGKAKMVAAAQALTGRVRSSPRRTRRRPSRGTRS